MLTVRELVTALLQHDLDALVLVETPRFPADTIVAAQLAVENPTDPSLRGSVILRATP